jgi:hypothetical protein
MRAVAVMAAAAISLLAATAAPVGSSTGGLVHTGVHCGSERWAVKTLSDPAASSVNFQATATTVDALRAKMVAPTAFGTPRRPPVETTTYRVHARLVEARLEADKDIHLVIADPSNAAHTMIVELPNPVCDGVTSSIKKAQITAARTAFITKCGLPPAYPTPFRQLHGTATITGVGFIDVAHSSPQEGVGPHNLELHPVLSISNLTC